MQSSDLHFWLILTKVCENAVLELQREVAMWAAVANERQWRNIRRQVSPHGQRHTSSLELKINTTLGPWFSSNSSMSLPAFFSWEDFFAENICNFVSISQMKTSQRRHRRTHHYFGFATPAAQQLLYIWQKHLDIGKFSSISPTVDSVAKPIQKASWIYWHGLLSRADPHANLGNWSNLVLASCIFAPSSVLVSSFCYLSKRTWGILA